MRSIIKQAILTAVTTVILASCLSAPTQVATAEFTKTARPTLTPTIVSTDTPAPIVTPEVKTIIYDNYTSPDNMWTATISTTTQGKKKSLLFKVSNNFTYKSWVIENTNFIASENPLEGYIYPYVFKWSKDGKHLYYSHLSTGGDGCFVLSKPGGLDLQRIDLISGEINSISENGGIWMALSPDENKLAYIDSWGGNVTLLNIETKKETTYPLPSLENKPEIVTDTSNIYWSPNGKSLIYVHSVNVCPFPERSYIIQLYPDTQLQEIIVSTTEGYYYFPVEWNISDRVVLIDNQNNFWWLNPNTKEIIPAQP